MIAGASWQGVRRSRGGLRAAPGRARSAPRDTGEAVWSTTLRAGIRLPRLGRQALKEALAALSRPSRPRALYSASMSTPLSTYRVPTFVPAYLVVLGVGLLVGAVFLFVTSPDEIFTGVLATVGGLTMLL